MKLFEIATGLQARLEAASAADAGFELLLRGRSVRDNIALAVSHLEAVRSYRVTIGRTDVPPFDAKAIRETADRFREALAKSGPKALQQESTAKLETVLTVQIERIDRWVKSTWSKNFDSIQTVLDRVLASGLHGSTTDRIRAQNRASTIEFIRRKDPIRERTAVEERLHEEGLAACLARAKEMIGELQEAIAAIDLAQAEMVPEVQVALKRAGSVDGLPLSEVTPELLAELRSAGVVDDFVVRRL